MRRYARIRFLAWKQPFHQCDSGFVWSWVVRSSLASWIGESYESILEFSYMRMILIWGLYHIFVQMSITAGLFWLIKGIGGVQGQKLDFLYFLICCSPMFLVSKMGSFMVWIFTVGNLWPLPWCAISRMYGKSHTNVWEIENLKKTPNFQTKKLSPPPIFVQMT